MNLHKSRSKDQNSSVKVTPVWWAAASSGMGAETLYVCWLQDLCSWREADNGNLRGFRELSFIFPTGVAKEKRRKKRRKKILRLSLKLHIFRFYN